MPQDAFTLRLNAIELNEKLRGGKINKINQPERDEVILLIYTGKRTVKLALNANASDCGVYFSETEKENPAVAPNFCMLLRKHLQGAEILDVSLVGFERILCIRFYCISDFAAGEKQLYCEIMGKYSNLVLTENGVILGALKTTSIGENCKRVIFSGAKYALPEPQDKIDPTDFQALSRLLSAPVSGDFAQFLFQHVRGVAPVTAEAIVKAYRGGDFAKHVYDYLFSNEISACVTERDFLARYEEGAMRFSSLSEAQAYFYGRRTREKKNEALQRKLLSAVNAALKKQEKRLTQTLEKQNECKDAEENRIKGELLTANLYQLQRGMRGAELYNFYDEAGGTLKITLDVTKSPSENAQSYFKKYRKQKRTLETLAPMAQETRVEIDYLHSLLSSLNVAKNYDDLTCVAEELAAAGLIREQTASKKKTTVKPSYRIFERDGFRICAGRNNMENDRLVRSSASNDIWLHAQKYHSAHVVIETHGRKVPDDVLLYAAGICAAYSDGKGDKVPVDYCEIKFVKKPPKSKPGFVVYTDYKTIYTAPIQE